MSRTIVTTASFAADNAAGTPTPPVDDFSNQILKLIPTDVVGVYLGITSLIALSKINTPHVIEYIQLGVFILLLFLTPLYLSRALRVKDTKQVIIATLSFLIWALSLGSPFSELFKYWFDLDPDITKLTGGILIMIYTLIVPIIYQKVPSKP